MIVQSPNTQAVLPSNDILLCNRTTTENASNTSTNLSPENPAQKDKPLIDLIKKADKDLIGKDTSVQYSIHKETNDLIIKIIDNKTKEVVKEFPSEKILDMVANMCKKVGIFIDDKS